MSKVCEINAEIFALVKGKNKEKSHCFIFHILNAVSHTDRSYIQSSLPCYLTRWTGNWIGFDCCVFLLQTVMLINLFLALFFPLIMHFQYIFLLLQTIVTGAGDETLRFWNVFPSPKSQVSNSRGSL